MGRAVLFWLLLAAPAAATEFRVWIDPRLPADRVRASMRAWEQVANVRFREGKSEDALLIQLGAIEAPAGLQYFGLYRQATNTITISDPDPYVVSQTLMHELGHFLGLYMGPPGTPHCPDPECLMYAVVGAQRKVCRQCVAQVIARHGRAPQQAHAQAAKPANCRNRLCDCGYRCTCTTGCDCGFAASSATRMVEPFPGRPTALVRVGDVWRECEVLPRSTQWHFQLRSSDGDVFWIPRQHAHPLPRGRP